MHCTTDPGEKIFSKFIALLVKNYNFYDQKLVLKHRIIHKLFILKKYFFSLSIICACLSRR